MKKRNLILIILGGAFFALAILALIIANAIMGTDFVALLSSRWAIFIYVFLGLYLLVVGFVLISDKVKRL